MESNTTALKGTAKQPTWLLRRVAMPLLLALLAFGLVGMSTGQASSSASLRPAAVSTQRADSAPALIALNGTIYVGWTGRNMAHNLNLMTYHPTSQTFGPAQVLTDTTLVESGPSLTVLNGNLYVAWMGTDHRLNVGRYNPSNPTHLSNKVTLAEYSKQAPSFAALNGRLYLSWRGTDGRLNIISSANAGTFNTKVTYNIAIRTSPTIAAKNALFVAWEDMSPSSHIVFAQYNPSNPAVLKDVVTTTSTSTLPVSFYIFKADVTGLDFRVAWRTATNAHINLAFYQGDQNLRFPTITTETTPYGPATHMSYFSWTGTDAARSINVKQINFS